MRHAFHAFLYCRNGTLLEVGHITRAPKRAMHMVGRKVRMMKENAMFAVMKTGGKQYKVRAGDVLRVEKLQAEAGETVEFNEILMVGGDKPTIGQPFVSGAAVKAEVIEQIKGEKLIHYVKRRRKHSSQRKKGHRQKLTLLRITDIAASGK
jgi:large subunit ribosomal protein L21